MSVPRPRIDVVMATYNGARFLREQLDSIATQSIRPDQLIIVDDQSTDNSFALLQTWAEDKPWVQVHRQPSNQGVNATFQAAWQRSTADWVFFADQDDIWHPDKLERFLPLLGEVDLCYSDACIIDEHGKRLHESEMQFHHSLAVSGRNPGFFLLNNCVSGHNLAASRALLARASPVPADTLYDHWLALLASCGNGIRYLPEPTCAHRMHSNNLANNPTVRKRRRQQRDRQQTSAPVSAIPRLERILAALQTAGEMELREWLLLMMQVRESSRGQRLYRSIQLRHRLLPHFSGWQRWRRLWKLRQGFGET